MLKQECIQDNVKLKESILEGSIDELKHDNELILENLDSILVNQRNIIEKLSGSGIGKVQETMTIHELKSSFPNDQFSDEDADKHGTDIIATICETGITLGKITISVKHQKKWSSEFVRQLEDNISNDNTRWGFLVTTVFPSDALNNRIWSARTSSGRLILLVKPEFTSVAYYAIRTIVIYEFQLQKFLELHYGNIKNDCQNSKNDMMEIHSIYGMLRDD